MPLDNGLGSETARYARENAIKALMLQNLFSLSLIVSLNKLERIVPGRHFRVVQYLRVRLGGNPTKLFLNLLTLHCKPGLMIVAKHSSLQERVR